MKPAINAQYFQKRIAGILIKENAEAKKKLISERQAQATRSKMISRLLEETVGLLDEADEMGGAPPADPSAAPAAPPPPAQQATNPGAPVEAGMPGMDPTADPNSPEVTLEKVIAKLNTIRGGKSLREPTIYNKLNTYYNSLEEEKKSQLFDFLSNIAQVITDILDGTQQGAAGAMDPAAMPPADPTTPPATPPAPAMAPPPAPAAPATPIQPVQ